ncbi:MAG TPA: ribosome silencing factor [Gammaproteobacteria bacterium]|nr:ribosome silencing factor [Gammaproteobacteria bacterium]
MNSQQLTALAQSALDDLKAKDVTVIDITDKSSIADAMVIATGTSDRHVGALANEVVFQAKAAGEQPLGIEGESSSDWVLVDLGDVIVHVMTQKARDFYELEKLWSVKPSQREAGIAN